MTWTLFQSIRDTRPPPYQTRLEKFSSYFSKHKVVSHKKSVPLFPMSIYEKSSSPGNDHIHSTFAAVLDFDEQHEHTKTLKGILPLFKRYSFFVYTTAKSLCVHSLRHTLITTAHLIGISLWAIKRLFQRLLRHSGLHHHNLQELTYNPRLLSPCRKRGTEMTFRESISSLLLFIDNNRLLEKRRILS